jgi:hypothetical protein
MKYLLLSLCLIPAIVFSMNPTEHRRHIIIESQIIQIRDILKTYQQIMDYEDYQGILYNLYVVEVMLH